MIGPDRGRPYANGYLVGVGMGILVTAAFAMGKWFGASRFFVECAKCLSGDGGTLRFWMGEELLGIGLGALLGSLLFRRFSLRIERGPGRSAGGRLLAAAAGGGLVMIGSRLGLGCTSGIALSGGARLSTGAFVFMGAMFAGGFVAAALLRRLWS